MPVLLSSPLLEPSQLPTTLFFPPPPTHVAQARALTRQIFDGSRPWGLCCPLLHHRHLPLIGCARTFIGIGVFPSSLEPWAGSYRCIRPVFPEASRAKQDICHVWRVPANPFSHLVWQRCGVPAVQPASRRW